MMDTIDNFLDAMFAPYPATPRLLEAKAELRTMMEDAYSDAISRGRTHNEAVGQVITDFGNLEELAPTWKSCGRKGLVARNGLYRKRITFATCANTRGYGSENGCDITRNAYLKR